MKNFNIFGVNVKIRVLQGKGGGGVHEKPIYSGGLPKKGAWTVCRFKGGGLSKKKGGVDTPMHTMNFYDGHLIKFNLTQVS